MAKNQNYFGSNKYNSKAEDGNFSSQAANPGHETVTEFDKAIMQGENFLQNNWKALAIGIGVILAIVLGTIYYFVGYKAPRNKEANELIFKAEQAFRADSFNVALNGDGVNVGFLSIIDNYSGTDAANAANMYAGLCYKGLGENENAISYLNSFNGDGIIEPAINVAIAGCYWDSNNEDKAASYYKKAADAKDLTVSPVALQRLGLIYLKKGDLSNAKDCFETIKNSYANSVEAQDIDKYIESCE